MKCDEKDEMLGGCTKLNGALHQLGMLSVITDARRDFLRENRTDYGIVRMNTRYVSDVTVGYCMRRSLPRHRVCPYSLPHRHRTKSENSDSKEETRVEVECETKERSVKRCQSLESLGPGEQVAEPDLDGVSTRIEKLQVDEQ